jgi:hypothetical protein
VKGWVTHLGGQREGVTSQQLAQRKSPSPGQRRTKHELVTTEVAASLRYAEASITRAARPVTGEDDDLN